MAKFTEEQAIEFYKSDSFSVSHIDTDPINQHLIECTYNEKNYSITWMSAFDELEWTIDNISTFIQTQDL
tara:strand:+ start:590 stop:799 length:210 start_codon:yes stop_codon:yes gene_type:complete